ncbi:glycerophosphodiester phosphodiesterase [Sutcliffiella cohnii]|uniref:glycerophosphodiester phosphodiesterase n=1 Tax=Sutcliffiella cohnii TaxID=33932 RepID=UPI002E21D6ED|nr:glycerophosphodiester phosphodiesterase [Sutcliffiella cohnii]
MIQSPIRVHHNYKKRKKKKVFFIIPIIAIIYFALFHFVSIHSTDNKPFFTNDRPLVIAHQGGEHLAPSNTIEAFANAVQLGVDVLETDIHITKDGHLVAIHDSTVDRTTDGLGFVEDFTLEELQQLDAGFYFQDLSGEYSFRDQGVYIPTLDELFGLFPDIRWEIEIKDDNPPERIDEIITKLWELIQKYGLQDRVLVASFDHNIIKAFQKETDGEVAVAGGRSEIKRFVILHKLFARNLFFSSVDAFQIPTENSGLNLTKERLIKDAGHVGVELHYWTINDKQEMRMLLERGASGIITDRPDLLLEVLEEMGY